MIDKEKLRAKLADLWKKKPPVTPASFAEADRLINEVIEAATVIEETVVEEEEVSE